MCAISVYIIRLFFIKFVILKCLSYEKNYSWRFLPFAFGLLFRAGLCAIPQKNY